MNIHAVGGALIVSALLSIASPAVRCLAQSDNAKVSAAESVNANKSL